jgi:hypothetical protein
MSVVQEQDDDDEEEEPNSRKKPREISSRRVVNERGRDYGTFN